MASTLDRTCQGSWQFIRRRRGQNLICRPKSLLRPSSAARSVNFVRYIELHEYQAIADRVPHR